MKAPFYAGGAILVAVISVPAVSQSDDRPIRWHVGLTWNPTIGTTGDYLDDGFGISGGLTWRPRPDMPLALRAELQYSGYDATDKLIELGTLDTQTRIDDGDANVFGADVSGVYDFPLGMRAHGYAQAGIGLFRREVDLTQTVLFSGIFCDRWWGVCFPGVAAGSSVVAENTTTRFGWNAGVGVEFPTSAGSAWFVDARYLQISTQDETEFIPIRFGYRF